MHVDEFVVLRSQFDHGVHGTFAELTALLEIRNATDAISTHFQAFLNQIRSGFAMRTFIGVHALLREGDDLQRDRIFQFLLKLQQGFERGKIRIGHIGVRTNELHAMTHFLGDADFRAFLDLVDSEICFGFTPTLDAFEQGA